MTTSSGTTDRVPCPVCLHEETFRARLCRRTPCYDDIVTMDFEAPSGDALPGRGAWACGTCGARLTPYQAGVLLDAALMHVDPHCDSIRGGVHEDARRALRGGRGE